ncbi:archaeal flagella protein [Halalkalicoccus paucihalophilus]|uniref:Archaeal flagella protein n=2 Tax=Halalkalicoccus paucihalophilus TaxID=1008153 RepID=A0A151ACN9_9EURY|nr:archaeal flagella protein [Halalkalicoccus paucihalophilus]
MAGDDDEYATEELEQRVDDVETELESITSTVNTIRSENEEIEENVRKLLNVYEMVTRGVNPFTDDEDGAGGGASNGSLGLFDGDETTDEAAAFDDDPEESGDDAGSTDFDDLKAEYESEEVTAEESDSSVDGSAIVPVEGPRAAESDQRHTERTLSEVPDAEKPYLRGPADGYVADLLILEWLEYLVETGGIEQAETAIEYYESIRWIDEDAGDQLRAFIAGFEADEGDQQGLSVADHTQSLRYICQLASSTAAPVVLEGWTDGSRRAEQ